MAHSDSQIACESTRPSVRAGFTRFVRELRQRKEGAIQKMVDRYESLAINTVRRHLGKRLRERVDSHDLKQDFWVSMIRRIDRLPSIPDSQALRGYLRRVAFRQVTKQQRRHLIAERRRLTREVPLSAAGDGRGGGPAAEDAETLERAETVEEMLDRLRPHLSERETEILAKKLEGLSNREIARAIGINEGSVRRSLRKTAKVLARGVHLRS